MVDYLMEHNLASSRVEGISIGQELLMTLRTVEHVVVSTCGCFKDDSSSLYRFSQHQILLEISTLLQTNIHCRTHSHHFKKYKDCFIGSDVVDYLMENKLVSSRADGVVMGQHLIMTLGTVECVSAFTARSGGEQSPHRHEFKDDSSFYRFKARSNGGDANSPPPSPCETATTLSNHGNGDGEKGVVIKMDKYGFLLDDDDDEAVATTSATTEENLFEVLCPSDAKWEKLLDKIIPINTTTSTSSFSPSGLKRAATTTSTSANVSKVKNYARRGLPDSVRPRAWTTLTGVDVVMNRYPRKYNDLVQQAEEEYRKHHVGEECATVSLGTICCNAINASGASTAATPTAKDDNGSNRVGTVLDTIERDIHRTFPKHYLFHSGFDEAKDDDIGNGNRTIEADSDNIASDDDNDDEGDERCSSVIEDGVEIDETTGIDTTFDVEAKKKLFNESMNTLMTNISCGVLDNIAENINENAGSVSKEILTTENQEGSVKDDDTTFKTICPQLLQPPLVGMGLGHGQNALRRVLRAYSMYDTDVGYCQGMNYITAMFLTFISEEKAFWLLVVVMNDEPYKLRDLFGEDMAGAHEVLFIAEKLLAQFLPKLSKHLEAESIHISMFVTPWLLTAYTSTFPFDLVARVWDCFLVEGWKVLYRVMLSLLEFASKDILNLQFEQILSYFRDFPTKVNGRVILASSLKIGLKKKHIQKHAKEWRRHAGSGGGKQSR